MFIRISKICYRNLIAAIIQVLKCTYSTSLDITLCTQAWCMPDALCGVNIGFQSELLLDVLRSTIPIDSGRITTCCGLAWQESAITHAEHTPPRLDPIVFLSRQTMDVRLNKGHLFHCYNTGQHRLI